MNKPLAEFRKATGNVLHGNLGKAPNLAAVAYHRRRICHCAISSLPTVAGAGSDHTRYAHLAGFAGDLFPVCYPWRLRKAVQQGSIKANY